MERRPASTEEEEMNQRRRLLNLARKGDPKAISRLFELYQVRVYSGETLAKAKRSLSAATAAHEKTKPASQKRTAKRPARKPVRKSARKVFHKK
jgi:hypothetical protein